MDLKALTCGCVSHRKRCVPRSSVKLELWAVKTCDSRHSLLFFLAVWGRVQKVLPGPLQAGEV